MSRVLALFRLGTTDSAVVAPVVRRRRRRVQFEPIPTPRTRWYLSDIPRATNLAAMGDLALAAQLYRAMLGDGVFSGLLGTRTSGLVSLPRRFFGTPEVVSALQSKTHGRSVFDEMFPPAEVALLEADGIMLGVGLAELVPVKGDDGEPNGPPVMRRLDPEFLYWDWGEGMWFYRSLAGPQPIMPGDGRWILHVPGGAGTPWQSGLWRACGRAYIIKEHAVSMRQNYATKLANPARVAYSPAGTDETQRAGFLKKLMAWGLNSVFQMTSGWEVKLLESNGRGYQVWTDEITSADHDFMIALAGQEVTTTGGTGFANADIHQAIRSDLIKASADALAYTLNTQGIPQYIESVWGEGSWQTHQATVEWDSRPAKDLMNQAQTFIQVAAAITNLSAAMEASGRELDVAQVAAEFGVPVLGDVDGDGTPDEGTAQLKLVQSDRARVTNERETGVSDAA